MKPPTPKKRSAGKRGTRAAVIQAAPVFGDLQRSLEKALTLAGKSARKGAKVIAFGETWLPGYPAWLDHCPDAALWNHPPVQEVFAQLRQNSLAIPSNESKRIAAAAADLGVTIVIGVNERVERGRGNRTLYNSLLTFTPDGKLANHHRKLMPTYTERLVWGQGDGGGLEAADTPAGRVGGLICWEHWMPLSRQAMHDSGEDIHVAVWPMVHDLHQLASRHYAFEGRCFVLAAGLIMPATDLPRQLGKAKVKKNILRGGSAIIAPDGRYLAGPVFDEESILVADLDLSEIDRLSMTLDVSGHYSRPDVFEFSVKAPPSRAPKSKNRK